MFVFELTIPGTWLDYKDRNWARKTEGLLRHLESHFFEANTALNLFIQSRSIRQSSSDLGQWEHDSQRRSEIRQQIKQEMKVEYSIDSWDEIHFKTEVRFKREQWSHGRLPREFEFNMPIIYARAFLYAIDAFGKFLKVLSREPDVPLFWSTHSGHSLTQQRSAPALSG